MTMVSRRRLEQWERAGIIDNAQLERILVYEREARVLTHALVWSIAAVGGLAIGAGIISVIAAHWEGIPGWLKLGLGVGILASLPLVALRLGDRAHGWPRDLVLVLHQLLVVAIIGLIGQVFHLHGAPWRVFALATAFAIPAAAAGRRQLHVDVVIGFALALIATALVQANLWDALWDSALTGCTVTAALAVLLYCAGVLLRQGAAFVAIPLKRWGIVGLFAMLTAQSLRWGFLEHDDVDHLPLAIGALVIAGAAAVAVVRRPSLAWLAFAACAVITLLGPDIWFASKSLPAQIVAFVVCGVTCLSWSFLAAERGVRWSVNLATLALGARIVIAFFDLFGSLMDTGIALLTTGFVLIAVAFGWWKVRAAIPIHAAGATS